MEAIRTNGDLWVVPSDTGATAERQTFGFESDFVASLRCLPMAVRLKLDRCGLKLSLRQWSRLSAAERIELLEEPCASPAEVDGYRELVTCLVKTRSGEAVRALGPALDERRAREGQPPDQVLDQAERVGASPPSDAAWRRLSLLQRFALLKLSREGHDNVNFLPALIEFGVDPHRPVAPP